MGSTLTTASGSRVVVINGNSTDGVFFRVGSSATLGSGTVFAGNILALDSISFDSSANIVYGRAIALTGAISMIGNTISNDCSGPGSEGSGTDDFGSVGFSGGDFTSLGYIGASFDGIPGDRNSSTPKPSTIALLMSGLLGLVGFAALRSTMPTIVLPAARPGALLSVVPVPAR